LINGRRLQDAQLCLSNPEVIDKLIENLGKEIAKKPGKNIGRYLKMMLSIIASVIIVRSYMKNTVLFRVYM